MEDLTNAYYDAVEDESAAVAFTIKNDYMADWALRKVKEENDDTQRLIELADMRIAELEEQKAKLISQRDHRTGFLRAKLCEYAQNVPMKETKTQRQYKLLSGSLIIKKEREKIIQPSADDLLPYLRENAPEYIKHVESPAWGDFKKNLSIQDGRVIDIGSGEVIDCIKVELEPESFDVKF